MKINHQFMAHNKSDKMVIKMPNRNSIYNSIFSLSLASVNFQVCSRVLHRSPKINKDINIKGDLRLSCKARPREGLCGICYRSRGCVSQGSTWKLCIWFTKHWKDPSETPSPHWNMKCLENLTLLWQATSRAKDGESAHQPDGQTW